MQTILLIEEAFVVTSLSSVSQHLSSFCNIILCNRVCPCKVLHNTSIFLLSQHNFNATEVHYILINFSHRILKWLISIYFCFSECCGFLYMRWDKVQDSMMWKHSLCQKLRYDTYKYLVKLLNGNPLISFWYNLIRTMIPIHFKRDDIQR